MSEFIRNTGLKLGWGRYSLISRISISMLVLTLCAMTGMTLSAVVASSIKGNAHAINRIGYMRMQSYQLLSLLPLDAQEDKVLFAIESGYEAPFLEDYVQERGLTEDYQSVQDFWQKQVKPALIHATKPDEARTIVKQYVSLLDQLVRLIDIETEHRLWLLKSLQSGFIFITLVLLVLNIWHLRRRIFYPWRQLLNMTFHLKNGQLDARYSGGNKKDEMNQLGAMLNSMADELQSVYNNLESLVEQKTQSLQYKNTLLDFLYRSSGPLISDNSERHCRLFAPILQELKSITHFSDVRLEILDIHRSSNRQVISTNQYERPTNCMVQSCNACIQDAAHIINGFDALNTETYLLEDGRREYGYLVISMPPNYVISEDEKQLVETLSKQLTRSLASKYQEYLNGELLLANERTAIARELHDSLAQSLSCLKIRLSCLQMQQTNLSDEQQNLIKEMRHEIDSAYTQLRHLLSTFRLKLKEPGLLPALESTLDEFNLKLGYPVLFHYDVPANCISSAQAVHFIQIVREALSNIYKHASAKEVVVEVSYDENENRVTLNIKDNGCGMEEIKEPANHYGLTIMNDRAKLLPGEFEIHSKRNQGTEITVKFNPQ